MKETKPRLSIEKPYKNKLRRKFGFALLAIVGSISLCHASGLLNKNTTRLKSLEEKYPGTSCYYVEDLGYPQEELLRALGIETDLNNTVIETLCTSLPKGSNPPTLENLKNTIPSTICTYNPRNRGYECEQNPGATTLLESKPLTQDGLYRNRMRYCIHIDKTNIDPLQTVYTSKTPNGCLKPKRHMRIPSPQEILDEIKREGERYFLDGMRHFFGGAILNIAGRTLKNPYSVSPESRQQVLRRLSALHINPNDPNNLNNPQRDPRLTRRSQANLERHNGDNRRREEASKI